MIECKDCRFFEPLEWEPTEGACRRFPWKFRRGIHDWCGEGVLCSCHTVTPVQAIEAMLGRTCEVVYVVETYDDLADGFGLARECYAKKDDAIRRCEALTYEEDGIHYWACWTELKVEQ